MLRVTGESLGVGLPAQGLLLECGHSHHSQGYDSFLVILVPAFRVSSLLQVSASDDDGPVNSAITYSLVGGNQLGHFTINPKKGQLQVAKALDWEQVSHIQAEQRHGPYGKSRE